MAYEFRLDDFDFLENAYRAALHWAMGGQDGDKDALRGDMGAMLAHRKGHHDPEDTFSFPESTALRDVLQKVGRIPNPFLRPEDETKAQLLLKRLDSEGRYELWRLPDEFYARHGIMIHLPPRPTWTEVDNLESTLSYLDRGEQSLKNAWDIELSEGERADEMEEGLGDLDWALILAPDHLQNFFEFTLNLMLKYCFFTVRQMEDLSHVSRHKNQRQRMTDHHTGIRAGLETLFTRRFKTSQQEDLPLPTRALMVGAMTQYVGEFANPQFSQAFDEMAPKLNKREVIRYFGHVVSKRPTRLLRPVNNHLVTTRNPLDIKSNPLFVNPMHGSPTLLGTPLSPS